MENWVDICPFKSDWDSKNDFNMFTESWPKKYLVFANPPYSQTASAVYKAILEFMKGVNVVLLVPYNSVCGEGLKSKLLDLLGCKVKTYPIAFEG